MVVALIGACIAALGVALIAGAEQLRDRALRQDWRGPAWLRRGRGWWVRNVVRRPEYVRSFRLVGLAWFVFGLVVLVGGLRQP